MTYNIYRNGAKIKAGLTDTTFTDTGLKPNTSYTYQVSAENESGEGLLSDPILVKTPGSTPVYVSKISLSSEVGNFNITTDKGTLQLLAAVEPENATDKSVTWSSDKPELADVSPTGLVTAKANGTASIRATAKDGSGVNAALPVFISGQA